MSEASIPSLDPDDSLFLGRLNSYFCEEVESVEDVSRADLVWYLRTIFIGHDDLLSYCREKDKRIAELEQLWAACGWLYEIGEDGMMKHIKVEGEGDTWHIPESMGLAILMALRGDE